MINHFTRFLFWVDDDLFRFYLGNQGEFAPVFFFSWDISCGLQENFDAQLEKNCLL
jgi:hypothetical protein